MTSLSSQQYTLSSNAGIIDPKRTSTGWTSITLNIRELYSNARSLVNSHRSTPMIKLLALDLDGTLLNSRGQVPDTNRDAIRAAEERGVLVTIATGRRFRDGRPLGIELELNAPLITHNGALLKYADSLETVAASLLTTDTAREVVRVGKAFGGDALVSADPQGK